MGFIFIPVYVHFLGIEAYGLVGVFAVLQAWLTLVEIGMRPTLALEMARFSAGRHNATSIRELLRTFEIIGCAIAAAIAVVVLLASGWLSDHWLRVEKLPHSMVTHAMAAMGLVIALRLLENLYVSAIAGLQRQVLHNIVTSLMATIRGVGAIGVLAWVSASAGAFFVWQGVVSVLTALILGVAVHNLLPSTGVKARFSLAAIRGVWRFAAGMSAITVFALLLTQMDKIILSRMLTLTAFSYYSLAGTVTGALYVLTGPINAAYNPRLAELAATGDQEKLRVTYHQGAQLVSVVLGPAAVVVMVFSARLLDVWAGDPHLTSRVDPFVPVLALGVLLNGLVNLPYQLQLAHGWTRLALQTLILSVLVLLPAILLLVPHYGAISAAWCGVAMNGIFLVFNVHFMHKRLLPAERRAWYIHDVAVPLAAAFAIALVGRLLLPANSSRTIEGLQLIGLYACSAAASILVAPVVRRRIAYSIRSSLRMPQSNVRGG